MISFDLIGQVAPPPTKDEPQVLPNGTGGFTLDLSTAVSPADGGPVESISRWDIVKSTTARAASTIAIAPLPRDGDSTEQSVQETDRLSAEAMSNVPPSRPDAANPTNPGLALTDQMVRSDRLAERVKISVQTEEPAAESGKTQRSELSKRKSAPIPIPESRLFPARSETNSRKPSDPDMTSSTGRVPISAVTVPDDSAEARVPVPSSTLLAQEGSRTAGIISSQQVPNAVLLDPKSSSPSPYQGDQSDVPTSPRSMPSERNQAPVMGTRQEPATAQTADRETPFLREAALSEKPLSDVKSSASPGSEIRKAPKPTGGQERPSTTRFETQQEMSRSIANRVVVATGTAVSEELGLSAGRNDRAISSLPAEVAPGNAVTAPPVREARPTEVARPVEDQPATHKRSEVEHAVPAVTKKPVENTNQKTRLTSAPPVSVVEKPAADQSSSLFDTHAPLLPVEETTAQKLDPLRAVDQALTKGDPVRTAQTQVVDAARRLTDGSVEIQLSPEELGRVKLTVSQTEGDVAITVVVERPETLDLMRRNADGLLADLRQAGYERANLNFAQDGNRGAAFQARPDDAPTRNEAEGLADATSVAPPTVTDADRGRLDIRV